MVDRAKILTAISDCRDPKKLRDWVKNAQKQNDTEIADAAFRQLIFVSPAEKPGTVEHDFWQTVYAFEFTLSQERGRTTRLARTRQKVDRVGVVKTLEDWALSGTTTNGFDMLIERGMPELTGEAIVIRHQDVFDETVIAAARKRLSEAGVSTEHYADVVSD